ncbi:hypothetical protein [Desulfobacula phenolica]|uniref:Uncharacterized protein n=1 Tax=Desulfobacula phenolica TaxID=90732 RepID=A0A1H2JQT5_9BACT|nr:hypothetical protein [Desulfobacula phenolica]SDU58385.1 hypothetical protein SAMN04487931_11423 [Desulfobacula phenolica]
MYAQVEKPKENKSRAVANTVVQKKSGVNQGFGFVDNRSLYQPIQKKENNVIHNSSKSIIQRGNTPSSVGTKEEKELKTQRRVDEILLKNPQIIVAPNHKLSSNELGVLEKYLKGELVLHRATQQWYRSFPKDEEYLELIPKGPKEEGTDPMPDFAENNTNWIPFTDDKQYAINISLSVGDLFREIWKKGEISGDKPMVIVQSINVLPKEPIAFGIEGEYQLKGKKVATEVLKIGVNDDLGNYNFAYQGLTFAELLK